MTFSCLDLDFLFCNLYQNTVLQVNLVKLIHDNNHIFHFLFDICIVKEM